MLQWHESPVLSPLITDFQNSANSFPRSLVHKELKVKDVTVCAAGERILIDETGKWGITVELNQCFNHTEKKIQLLGLEKCVQIAHLQADCSEI